MNIKDLLIKAVENEEEIYSVWGKVTAVNGKLCDVQPLNGDAEIQDVRLQAEDSEGFLIIPSVDSIVIVSFTNKDSGFVSMFSQIDGIELNGSAFGGLVKVEELVNKVNRLENALNGLITKFNSHTHTSACTAGGSITATPLPTSTETITPLTQVADIENETVTHGNGN